MQIYIVYADACRQSNSTLLIIGIPIKTYYKSFVLPTMYIQIYTERTGLESLYKV